MNNERTILNLAVRLLFYVYFTVWSLSFLNFIAAKSCNYSSGDDYTYLLSSEDSASVFKYIEENRRIKYPGEHNPLSYCSSGYLPSYGIHFFKLSGGFHFLNPCSIYPFLDVNSFIIHSRPPPGSELPA